MSSNTFNLASKAEALHSLAISHNLTSLLPLLVKIDKVVYADAIYTSLCKLEVIDQDVLLYLMQVADKVIGFDEFKTYVCMIYLPYTGEKAVLGQYLEWIITLCRNNVVSPTTRKGSNLLYAAAILQAIVS